MKRLLIVIAVIGALFAFLQFSNTSLIGDDDVYWHIRYSENILTIPHLTPAFFGDPIPYAGVLFHLILSPFTLVPNIFIGQKIAGVFFVCVIAALVYFLLKKLRISNPVVWTILVFMISINFTYRLLLVRTFLMSIVLLLAGIYCILSKRYWPLYFVSVAYALSYSIPFLLAVAGLWTVAQVIALPWKGVKWNTVLIVLVGIVTGIILHPVFPENIIFLKNFVLPVLYKVPVNELGGGVELTPFKWYELIKYEWMALALWFAAVVLFLKDYARVQEKTLKLFFMLTTAMFFVLAVMSRRFIEYWTPFAVISALVVLKPYFQKFDFKKFRQQLLGIWQMKVASVMFTGLLLLGIHHNMATVYSWSSVGAKIDPYLDSGQWISANIPAGSTVLNSDWTLYPKLYFFNSNANYIVQFDPAYLYLKNLQLYNLWHSIANDKVEEWGDMQALHARIANDFGADYLILKTNQNIQLKAFIEGNDPAGQYFFQEYEDNTLTIYKIVPK